MAAAHVMYVKLFIQAVFLFTAYIAPLQSSKMKINGKITVPSLKEGVSLAEKSFLTVKLEDTSRMDASAVLLGKDEQTLSARTKLGPGADGLNYTIVCERPEHLAPEYSVSAVLNVGWKPSGEEWIRKGDYFTDTTHSVDLTQETDPIVADIDMVYYPK